MTSKQRNSSDLASPRSVCVCSQSLMQPLPTLLSIVTYLGLLPPICYACPSILRHTGEGSLCAPSLLLARRLLLADCRFSVRQVFLRWHDQAEPSMPPATRPVGASIRRGM